MDDARLKRALRDLANQVARQERRLSNSERAQHSPRLGSSSIDSGALEVISPDGQRRMRIGHQPDGTAAVVSTNGPPPPAPEPAQVEPAIGGLRVTWDGTMSGGQPVPADLDRIAVHVSTKRGFAPAKETFAGSITRAGEGGALPVTPLPHEQHEVRLVAVTTSGTPGPPSVPVEATPRKVDGPDITAGAITASHIQAGAVDAAKLAATLVLGTSIVAGDPASAHLRLDQDGLRARDADDALKARIDTDGSAAFQDVVVGATDAYQIDATGAASLRQVSADTMYLDGDDLAERIAALPRGVLAIADVTGSSGRGTLPILIGRIVLPVVDTTRVYGLHHHLRIDMGHTKPTWVAVSAFVRADEPASRADPRITSWQWGGRYGDNTEGGTGTASDVKWESGALWLPSQDLQGRDAHIAFYLSAATDDGIRVQEAENRYWITDLGPAPQRQTFDISGIGTEPPTATYTKTWDATWSATWYQWGKRDKPYAYQGNPGGTGNQYAKIGFDSGIGSELSGATVKKVELYLRNRHFWYSSGGDAIIGTHGHSTEPGGSSSTSGDFDRHRAGFSKGQGKWVRLPTSIGRDFATGKAKGITLGSPSIGGTRDYGYFSRSGSGAPRLRITYEK